MANLDFDPTQAVDPATGLPLSRPIPGMAAAAIPGILGVVSPGLWNKQSPFPDSFADRFGNVKTTLPGDEIPPNEAGINATTGRASSIDDPTIGVNAAAIARRFPSAGAPGVMGSKADFPPPAMAAAPSNATPPDVLQPQSVLTSVERRSGDGPYAPNASRFEENAAAPPTTEEGGAFPNGSLAQRAENGQAPQGIQGLLGELFHNLGNFRDANRLTLLAMAGGLAGSQNWGTGLSRAFTAAVPAQRADIALGNQNATINYLVSHGFPPDLARSVGTNPELMQGAIGQMTGLSPPKAMTLQGPMGASLMQWNPQTRKWERVGTGGVGGGSSSGVGSVSPAAWDAMPVEQRLAAVSQEYGPEVASAVQAMYRGDATTPNRLAGLMPIATRVYGDFNANTYNTARKTQADFAPEGVSGKNITAIETALGHIDRMRNAGTNLGNFSTMPMLNAPYNFARGQVSPDYQRQVAAFQATATGSSGELAKAFRSAGMSDADINRWLTMFDKNSSPATIIGAADEGLHMLDSRLDAIADSYNRGMPASAAKKQAMDFLSGPARAIHDRIIGGGQPQPQAGPQAQGAQPAQQPRPTAPQMARVTSDADYNALPHGATYIAPDGSVRSKK